MKNYRMLVACPSAGRASTCTTHRLIDEVVYFVDESEAEGYRKVWDKVVVLPSGVNVRPNGKCKTLNYVLDNYFDKYDLIYFVDDDLEKFGRTDFLNKNKGIQASWGEVRNVIFHLKEIADKIGAKIGGFSCLGGIDDKIQMGGTSNYRLMQKKYIDGKSFIHFADDGIRYDEDLFLKEDICFNCESLLKNKRNLCAPFVVVKGKALTNKGGVVDVRTQELEIEHARKLIKKVGDMVSVRLVNASKSNGVRGQAVQMKIRAH